MTAPPAPERPPTPVPLTAAGLASVLALLFLGLWASGQPALQLYAGRSMKTNSAVCLALLSAGPLLVAAGRRAWLGRAFAALACGLALVTLGQRLTGLDLGIDQLLAVDRSGLDGELHPNRMSPLASLSFALLGLSIALTTHRRGPVLLAQILCAATVIVAALSLIGYLYGASFLYRPTSSVRFSPYSAAAALVLAMGVLMLRPQIGLARRFGGDGAGSLLARRMLVVLGLLPVLLGWLRLAAHRRGLFDDSAGTALLVIGTIVMLAAVLFVLARSLDRLDERRARSEAELRRSSELIAALARASTVADVANVVMETGLPALGASAGGLMLLSADGQTLGLYRTQGYDRGQTEPFARIAVDSPLPACQAARERLPVFVSGAAEYLRRYPALRADQVAERHSAWAALPLEGRDKLLGVIALSFDHAREFDQATQDHLRRLAWQCAQALERALLFDAQREAEERLRLALAEAQQAREAAESASRAKDEFLAMLGHELRNPLSPIVTSLHLMQMRGGDQLEKERATIERQVRHMVRLVDDLMDVSRITRGKIELRAKPVELAKAVNAAMEVVSPLIERQRHRVTVEVPVGLKVSADPERLSQIIGNLLSNAAKYTEPGGDIRITAGAEGDQARLTVADSGAGIPAELLPRIFDLFVQGGRTIERAEGGLGLGLAIVKSLVQLHGGTVEATSDGPGKGSRFSFTLPTAPAPAISAELPAIPLSPPPGVRRRILVVDDNRDAAEALGDALSSEGHEVKVAFDGASAVSMGQEYRPAVVFLDIGLPVMDGYEVARKLRALADGYRPLLVAISGYGQPGDRERALEAGFDQHLVKPVAVDVTLALAASEPPV